MVFRLLSPGKESVQCSAFSVQEKPVTSIMPVFSFPSYRSFLILLAACFLLLGVLNSEH
jgi:hypothetical protein